MTDQLRRKDEWVDVGRGKAPGTSGTYRAQLSTLHDDDERLSVDAYASMEKNRATLTALAGPGKGLVFPVNKEIVTVGRSEDADIELPDPGLSRIHARFLRVGTGRDVQYLLEDCGSLNGTFVAGKQIAVPTLVSEGVRVGFGRRSLLRFSVQDALEEKAMLNLHESALRDGLTRAYNRRVFDDRLASEFAYSARHSRPLSLMLIDIDYFKKLNDSYGHQAGDLVLQTVARQIASALRAEDVFARYGGEEFAVIARDTSLSEATVVAERVRALVSGTQVPWANTGLAVTVSIGIACNVPVVPDVGLLIGKADAALYRAKARGRDRVEATGLVRVKT